MKCEKNFKDQTLKYKFLIAIFLGIAMLFHGTALATHNTQVKPEIRKSEDASNNSKKTTNEELLKNVDLKFEEFPTAKNKHKKHFKNVLYLAGGFFG